MHLEPGTTTDGVLTSDAAEEAAGDTDGDATGAEFPADEPPPAIQLRWLIAILLVLVLALGAWLVRTMGHH